MTNPAEKIDIDALEKQSQQVIETQDGRGYAAGDETPWFIDPEEVLGLIQAVRAAQSVADGIYTDNDQQFEIVGDHFAIRVDDLRAALIPITEESPPENDSHAGWTNEEAGLIGAITEALDPEESP